MTIIEGIISAFVVLFAITVHEASHGWAALKMGDPTAYQMGRITLNPIRHIDPIGTVLLPAMLIIMGAPPFGWAKPVPVNPLNLKDPRRDNLIISIAGPASNISVAVVAFIILKILMHLDPRLFYSTGGGVSSLFSPLITIVYYTIVINVILAFFNLIPIPPLDGSGVVMGLISEEAAQKYEQIRPYGFFILILLIMTGFIGRILGVVLRIVNSFIY
ncbi:MAG: site-2 protease family protein [Candidatus Aminicenantes bacterium]|nr:MAG: site-2 protease family protein [Candidatus Aminicenantes bacterium]